MRFCWWHAGANVFVGEQLEVRLNFVVEICFAVIRGKDVAQETSCFREERHADTSTPMLVRRTLVYQNACYAGAGDPDACHTPRLTTTLAELARWPRRCDPSVWSGLRVASVQVWSSDKISRGDYFLSRPNKKKSNLLPPCGGGREKGSLA